MFFYCFIYIPSRSLNRLTPNDPYMSRTAPLPSKRCILYIYSTNIGTEYFKHALNSPFFSSKFSLFHNANLFGSCIIHILYTECAKIKKSNSGYKGLMLYKAKVTVCYKNIRTPCNHHVEFLNIKTCWYVNFLVGIWRFICTTKLTRLSV